MLQPHEVVADSWLYVCTEPSTPARAQWHTIHTSSISVIDTRNIGSHKYFNITELTTKHLRKHKPCTNNTHGRKLTFMVYIILMKVNFHESARSMLTAPTLLTWPEKTWFFKIMFPKIHGTPVHPMTEKTCFQPQVHVFSSVLARLVWRSKSMPFCFFCSFKNIAQTWAKILITQ